MYFNPNPITFKPKADFVFKVAPSVKENNLTLEQAPNASLLESSQATMNFNPNTNHAIVDGVAIETKASIDNKNRWRNLKNSEYRLRLKRADVFVQMDAHVDYVKSLCDYLTSLGLKVLPYDDSVNYLPSDILLLDKESVVRQGTYYYLNQGKRYIFSILKQEFQDKIG